MNIVHNCIWFIGLVGSAIIMAMILGGKLKTELSIGKSARIHVLEYNGVLLVLKDLILRKKDRRHVIRINPKN